MALGDEPLLMAAISVQGGMWRQTMVDLLDQAGQWFALQDSQDKVLVIRIGATEECVRFTERNGSLVIDIRKEHGPLGVLFGMALAKALGEPSVVMGGETCPLTPFNQNRPELSVWTRRCVRTLPWHWA